MIKSIKEIEKVSKFAISNLDLIFMSNPNYETRTGVLSIMNLQSLKIKNEIKLEALISEIVIGDDYLFCRDHENSGILLNYDLESFHRIPDPLKAYSLNKLSRTISIYKGKVKNREHGVYDFSTQRLLWINYNPYFLEFIGNYLIGQNYIELCRLEPHTGNIIWKTNFNHFASIKENAGLFSFIGVYKNILVVGLENIDKLIGINVETGKVIWEKNAIIGGLIIDSNKGVLHQMMVNYVSYNLEDGEQIDSYIDREYFETIGIETNRSNYVLDGDHIITTDSRKGNIGAFNTITHKFDWVHNLKGVSFPAAFPIIYKDGYLCILDDKQTLHIFEKENA